MRAKLLFVALVLFSLVLIYSFPRIGMFVIGYTTAYAVYESGAIFGGVLPPPGFKPAPPPGFKPAPPPGFVAPKVEAKVQVKKPARMCVFDEDHVDEIMNAAENGYRTETLLLEMLNCFVSTGEFEKVDSDCKTLDWLYRGYKGNTNKKNCIEFDGYNKDAKIAFEYNGPLHYDIVDETTRESIKKPNQLLLKKYKNYVDNDAKKKELCEERGIDFIILHKDVPKEDYVNYIKSRLKDIGKLNSKITLKTKDYINVIPEPENYFEKMNKPFYKS